MFPILEALAATIASSLEHDSVTLRSWISSLPEKFQAVLTHMLGDKLGASHDSTPTDLVEYQVKKSRLKNILEMLWQVALDIVTPDGHQMHLDYIVSAQPDPNKPGWWYVRLPNWKVVHFKPEFQLEPMHNLVNKTRMKEFFRLQRKLVFAELKWKELAGVMDWQQAMVSNFLLPHGEMLDLRHEPFSEADMKFFHLEDLRTRRTDYEWGKPQDPLDSHKPGKKTRKALIDGEIPVDVGSITLGDQPLEFKTIEDKRGNKYVDEADKALIEAELSEAVRWGEAELMCVGHPDNFGPRKKLSQIFRICKMADYVRAQFQTRLKNMPYWRVKDKRQERWYVYSYDWRTHRKGYSHSVIPIGHIVPARDGNGYFFFMYPEETLAKMRQQSLYIADYRLKITRKLAKKLDLDFDYVGAHLEFSVYNDWAMHIYRQLQEPATPRLFTREQLVGVPVHAQQFA